MFAGMARRRLRWSALALVSCTVVAAALTVPAMVRGKGNAEESFTTTFHLDRCTWATNGGNLFFSLVPGTQHILEGEESGEMIRTEITVLSQTRQVGRVPTRVIEEKHFVDGELDEISRNFYSMCREAGSVFYFGEEVDFYQDGQVVGHEGAWLAGVNGAQAGVYMPGLPLLGARYYQEIAPEAALDRAEVTSLTADADVPFGSFQDCLETVETTPLEPGAEGVKIYCPDIGIVDDEGQVLISYRPGRTGR
jgi:hypothetical protein